MYTLELFTNTTSKGSGRENFRDSEKDSTGVGYLVVHNHNDKELDKISFRFIPTYQVGEINSKEIYVPLTRNFEHNKPRIHQ